jgi:hypothetical protein
MRIAPFFGRIILPPLGLVLLATVWVPRHDDPVWFGGRARDASRGMQDPALRGQMAESLIASGVLLNKAEVDVTALLGAPDSRAAPRPGGSSELLYRVGASGVDDLWLSLVVNDGRVAQVRLRPD